MFPAALLLVLCTLQEAPEKPQGSPVRVSYSDGFKVAPGDGRFNGSINGRMLLHGAQRVPDDLYSYSHLPYPNDRVAGLGWSLVGDAA